MIYFENNLKLQIIIAVKFSHFHFGQRSAFRAKGKYYYFEVPSLYRILQV